MDNNLQGRASTSGNNNAGNSVSTSPSSYTTGTPRGRMPVSQRAKIFVPFDPLRGFQAALREQERLAEERFRDQDFSQHENKEESI